MTALVERHCDLRERVTRSRLLSVYPKVIHGLTGRVPGLGLADANIGFGAPRDPADAWSMRQKWCEAMGIDASTLVTVRQAHGADVARARRTDAGRGASPKSEPLGYADAIITNEPGIALMTLHADCLPILLYDPERHAIAAIHAGWRGTVSNVVGNTVAAMQEAFGTRPDCLIAFLGAAIRDCCYEVGTEVVEAWQRAASRRDGRWSFDVVRANQLILERWGVPREQIELSADCTRCHGDRWFSHRGQGPDTGRFAAIIALAEDGADTEAKGTYEAWRNGSS